MHNVLECTRVCNFQNRVYRVIANGEEPECQRERKGGRGGEGGLLDVVFVGPSQGNILEEGQETYYEAHGTSCACGFLYSCRLQ